jgi:hypothetical protein
VGGFVIADDVEVVVGRLAGEYELLGYGYGRWRRFGLGLGLGVREPEPTEGRPTLILRLGWGEPRDAIEWDWK